MNDGGPAFPHAAWEYTGSGGEMVLVHKPGAVTLRDYFAAAAISAAWMPRALQDSALEGTIGQQVAQIAYTLADRMIAERSKP